jgi:hypothetical protein
MILKETLDMENLLQMVHLSFLCGMEGFVLPLVCKRTLKFSKSRVKTEKIFFFRETELLIIIVTNAGLEWLNAKR